MMPVDAADVFGRAASGAAQTHRLPGSRRQESTRLQGDPVLPAVPEVVPVGQSIPGARSTWSNRTRSSRVPSSPSSSSNSVTTYGWL